jgi:hypothetical protein
MYSQDTRRLTDYGKEDIDERKEDFSTINGYRYDVNETD